MVSMLGLSSFGSQGSFQNQASQYAIALMKDKVWEKGSDLCLLNMPTKAVFEEEIQGSKPELSSAKVHSCSS